ncbi:MAG: DNA internalization-related competence protein ComEC/Rec2 [Clostridiales bacterium]|nr:DNA internalization-related competence protein ComEC/Rec2 [Clostridiales bacterium]
MRKLALFAFSFSAAVFLTQYLLNTKTALIIGLLAAAAGTAVIVIRCAKLRPARLILWGLALGFLWNCIYKTVFYEPANVFHGVTDRYSFTILDYPQSTDYGLKLTARLLLPGKPDIKSILYFYDFDASGLKPGQTISVKAKAVSVSDRPDYDHLSQKGCFLTFTAKEAPKVIADNSLSPVYYPVRLAYLFRRTVTKLFAEDVSPFLNALLTGDKTELNKDSYLLSVLSVTGASHTVAVSGMHLSFLVGLIVRLFGKRKRTYALLFPIILFYMLMVGSTPSIMRAGIMQILLLSAPLLMREYDSVTALGFALMVLLAVNPFSAKQAGLQLSFASVLGIHLFSGRLQNAIIMTITKIKPVERLLKTKRQFEFSLSFFFSKSLPAVLFRSALRFAIAGVAVSFAALVFVVPLTALSFEQVSLIAPVTNLLILWAVSCAFCIGIFTAILGALFMPLGWIFVPVVSLLVRYILSIMYFLAKTPLPALYTRNFTVSAWLVFFYLLMIIVVLYPGIKRKLLMISVPAMLMLSVVLLLTKIESDKTKFAVTALDVGQGQCIVFRSNGKSAIVDCGGNRMLNAGDNAVRYLFSEGESRVDLLILTHYHEDHANGVLQLLRRIKVLRLIVPDLKDKGELGYEILELAEKSGTEVTFVDKKTVSLLLGSIRFEIFPALGTGGKNEQGLCVLSGANGFDTLITGDIDEETEWMLLEYTGLQDLELLFAGHHGSRYSTCIRLLDTLKPEIVFISSGYNSYGHPSAETISRLKYAGIKVYRTDLNGQITLKLHSYLN